MYLTPNSSRRAMPWSTRAWLPGGRRRGRRRSAKCNLHLHASCAILVAGEFPMRSTLVTAPALLLAASLALAQTQAQTPPPEPGQAQPQVMGRGRGGAPFAWNDRNKDGICDLTGQPVGQRPIGLGRGRGFWGRGAAAWGPAAGPVGWGRGPCGRGFARWGRGAGWGPMVRPTPAPAQPPAATPPVQPAPAPQKQ